MSSLTLAGPGKITVEMLTGVKFECFCQDVRCEVNHEPQLRDEGPFRLRLLEVRKSISVRGTPEASAAHIPADTPARKLALAVLAGDEDAALALADEVMMTTPIRATRPGTIGEALARERIVEEARQGHDVPDV